MSAAEPQWAGVLHGLRAAGPAVRVIEPRQPGPIARVKEFWAHRGLVRFFGARLIRKMYQRTLLGRLWIPLRPTASVGGQALFFGGFLGVPSGGVPYVVFLLVGMTTWQYFNRLLYWGTRSIELSRRFLKRMYIPRSVLLSSAIAPAGLWFGMYMAITLIAVSYLWVDDGVFYFKLGADTALVVVGLLLATMMALSISLWTSVVGARWRDVRFSLRYVLNFWTYVTPVIYPLDSVPRGLQPIAIYNPMTAPLEMVKRGLLGHQFQVHTSSMWVTLITIAVVGLGGLRFFSRSEATAVDDL